MDIEIVLDGTFTLEHNGQPVLLFNESSSLILNESGKQTLRFKITSNPNKVPIVTTNHNVLVNGDEQAIITKKLNKLFTIKEKLYSDVKKGVYIYKIDDQKEYVVKAFKEETCASSKNFMREVKYLVDHSDGKSFKHPNIVKVYCGDTFKINDNTFNYYKMRYYQYSSLDKWIGKFENEKILIMIMLQLANSVHFIQSHCIIHRDIRPANIFIEKFIDGIPIIVLADFECATKLNYSSAKEASIHGAKICAPEVLAEGYSYKSDNFSIGLTMFELITGSCIFKEEEHSNKEEHAKSIIEKICSEYHLSIEFVEIIFNLLNSKDERMEVKDVISKLLLLLNNNHIKWRDYIHNANDHITQIVHSNTLIECGVIEQDYTNFKYISEKSKKDSDFKRQAVRRNGLVYQFFQDETDTNLIKLAFINNYKSLQYAPLEIRSNVNLMKEFAEIEPLCLEYVANSIKGNMNIEALVQKNGLVLRYAPKVYQSNLDIVKKAVLNNPQALCFANDEIRQNFLQKTLKINNRRLTGFVRSLWIKYPSNEFSNSKEIALESIRQNVLSFEYVDSVLKRDSNFIIEAIRCNNNLLVHIFGFSETHEQRILNAINNTSSELEISNTNILNPFLGFMKYLAITSLNISRNEIYSKGAKYISEMKQLTSLDISRNKIYSEGAKYISEMKQLTSLNISYNLLDSRGAKYICEMKQLTSLDISENVIDSEGAKYLSEMIKLTSLHISIDSKGAKYLSEMKQLTSLDIRWNKIHSIGAKYLSEMKQLTSLHISRNKIGSEGAKYISEMKELTSLDISWNEIDSEGAKYISEMKQLTSLNISSNLLDSRGAKYICEMKELTSLDISWNVIDSEGAKYLSEMIKLTSLHISINKIDSEGAKYLSEMKQLTSLDISRNVIGSKGAKYISEMKQLTSLDISRNKIYSEGATNTLPYSIFPSL